MKKTRLGSTPTSSKFDFKLQKSLFFYKNEATSQNLAVLFDKDMQDPQPLSKEQVQDLLPEDNSGREVYLKNTLYYSDHRMVWWVKGGMRYLDIVGKRRDKRYKLPRMLFKVERGKLFVAGFKGEPRDDTELLSTPFRGIDVHGNTMGACHVVKPTGQSMSDRDEWENAFFMSKFNQEPDIRKIQSLNKTLSDFIFCY